MAAVVITTDSSGAFSLFFVVHNAWFVFIHVDGRLVPAVVTTGDSRGTFLRCVTVILMADADVDMLYC